MASGDEDWPMNVVPMQPHPGRSVERPKPGPVTPLPSSELTVEWQGDEEWISTLPDPHDTTRTDEAE